MKMTLVVLLMSAALWAQTPAPFSPVNEGAYQVRIECRENAIEICQEVEGAQKMIMMSTRNSEIAVVIARYDLPVELYSFPRVKLDPTTGRYTAKGESGKGQPAEVALELDGTGLVVGWIRDPRFLNDLRITGKRNSNTASLYLEKSVPPVQVGDIIGVYYGSTSNTLKLKVTIQKSLTGGPKNVFASVLLNNIVYTHFPDGEVDSANGIVNLWAPLDGELQNKWTLKFKAEDSKRTLNGYGLLPRKGEQMTITLTRSEGP